MKSKPYLEVKLPKSKEKPQKLQEVKGDVTFIGATVRQTDDLMEVK